MTLIQDLRSKVKVTRDLFRSSFGPFILSYLLNLAKTTCRQWVYSTYTLTQVSMRKDRCHIRLLCKRLVHAVCVSSLFYLPYSTPYNAFMMYDTFRKKKIKLEVKVKQRPLTLNSEALGNGKKLHKLMLWHWTNAKVLDKTIFTNTKVRKMYLTSNPHLNPKQEKYIS